MKLKPWLLKYYSERYGIKKTARDIGISPKSLEKIIEGKMKIGSKNKSKLSDWQDKKKYKRYTKKEFFDEINPQYVLSKAGLTKSVRMKLRKKYKERSTARPRFRKVKKSLIKEEVKKKGIDRFARDTGIPKKEINNFLKLPSGFFIPRDTDVDKYLKYQKDYFVSKRGRVVLKAKKLGKSKFTKYKIFNRKDVRYFGSGFPYVIVYIPVDSPWIDVGDNPRVFDKLSRDAYDNALRSREFRDYGQFVGSIFGKITFDAKDDRDGLVWTVHETSSTNYVQNYAELKSELFGTIDYLIQLAEIFLQGKAHYNNVRIKNVSVYMKFREEYNVNDLSEKRRL